MLIIVASETTPQIGAKFVKYLSRNSYVKGEVSKFDGELIEVDFGDVVYEFLLDECSMVFDVANEEHLMSCQEGRLVKDMRPKRNVVPVNTDDLLDFSWMDSPIPD